MVTIHGKKFNLMISEKDILSKISELASKINSTYWGKNPLFIGVLNGSFMFAAELFKKLDIPAEISFVKVQSYTNTESTGKLNELIGITEKVENRDLIIVEDIVDTGLTISSLIQNIRLQNPKSIAIASLVFKPNALKTDFKPDYIGFEIEPKFVVGYGMDYNGLGRNLNGIYVLVD